MAGYGAQALRTAGRLDTARAALKSMSVNQA